MCGTMSRYNRGESNEAFSGLQAFRSPIEFQNLTVLELPG